MTDKITFEGTEYDNATLEGMTDEDLLTLRNKVAESLGATSVSGFKDHASAVAQTMKALEKFAASEEKPAKGKSKAKAPKERKQRGIPKSAQPHEIKRPTRKHFSTITKTGEHDGTGKHGRPDRWPNYKDGMTIADVIEGNGTEPWDVYNWEKQGIMKVTEPTDEEYAERRAAWFKKHGRTDPEVEKAEKAAAKAAKEAEKAEA